MIILAVGACDCFSNNRLFKPLGGEKVEYTDRLTVSWTADSVVTGVNIKKWDSNSKQWDYIATNCPTFSTYSWEIPDSLDGTECLIKLEFMVNGNIYSSDVGSAYFRVIAPVEIPHKNGIEEKTEGITGVLLYPNPIHNVLNIKGLPDNTKEILIKDINGITLKTISEVKGNELSVSISEFARGFYFVEIVNSNGQKYCYKFIKE